jgi:hypothetical protein
MKARLCRGLKHELAQVPLQPRIDLRVDHPIFPTPAPLTRTRLLFAPKSVPEYFGRSLAFECADSLRV